jgi:hypothetical protein
MATAMTQRLPKPISMVGWLAVIALGTFALSGIALNRGESIDAMWFIVAAICVYAIGYRFYSASATAAISCRRTAGSCSAITLQRSPVPAR